MNVTIHVDHGDYMIKKLNIFAGNHKDVLLAGLNIDSLIGLHGNQPNRVATIHHVVDAFRSGEVIRVGMTPCWPDGVRPSDNNAYILLQSPDRTKQWRVEKWFYPTPRLSQLHTTPYETEAYHFYADYPRMHGVVVQMNDVMFMEAVLAGYIQEDRAMPGPAAISSITFDNFIP
jgi:hypothetical protein